MSVELGGKLIDVFIVKKNNKNMYLRVKEDGIHISCNYFVTKSMIMNFIKSNESMIVEAYDRLQKKINLYCAHTNLDKALGGTTDLLLDAIKFVGKKYNDFVRIVELENEMSIEFMKLKLLPLSPHLRIVNNLGVKTIKTIGFCAGSGSEFIESTPCDAFVTGDLKYHTAVESKKVIFDIGHFESEIFAVKFLRKLIGLEEKGVIANETSPFI
jgi:putative NIF3 family GTP cyclohydrolase 1 type 2